MSDGLTLGGRIRARRRELKMTQTALASAVSARGIPLSQQNVVSIEKGKVFRTRALPEIAEVLHTTIDWLLAGKATP